VTFSRAPRQGCSKFLAVITPTIDIGVVALDSALAPFRAPGLSVENYFIDAGPKSIETERDIAECLPGLFRKAHMAVADGADAIVINCMCDPGVEDLRSSINTPVFAPAQTAMHIAAAMGARFAVIDVLAECREFVDHQVRRYGLEDAYASHRALDIPVVELHSNPPRTLAALEREGHAAIIDDGAELLILGCTFLAEFAAHLDDRLRLRGHRCQIIEPLHTTLAVARSLIYTDIATGARPSGGH
jgi:allantoin racemase